MNISFIRPQYLYLIFIIPFFIFFHFFSLRLSKRKALRFANFEAVEKIRGVDLFSKNIVILLVSSFILLFMILALSGTTLHRTIDASNFSFVLTIDTSSSMEATDILPTRLEGSKEIAMDFVDIVPPSTRLGVVSFSGVSVIESELSADKARIKSSLQGIQISSVAGTDIYEAVLTSSNLLVGEEAKAIILLGDGQINIGNLQEFIDYSNKHDIIVNTIAIGTLEGGETAYGISKLDEDSLKAIAYNTDGKYLRATDREGLESAFNEILELDQKKVSTDLSFTFLWILIILFIIFYLLVNTKYKFLP